MVIYPRLRSKCYLLLGGVLGVEYSLGHFSQFL